MFATFYIKNNQFHKNVVPKLLWKIYYLKEVNLVVIM